MDGWDAGYLPAGGPRPVGRAEVARGACRPGPVGPASAPGTGTGAVAARVAGTVRRCCSLSRSGWRSGTTCERWPCPAAVVRAVTCGRAGRPRIPAADRASRTTASTRIAATARGRPALRTGSPPAGELLEDPLIASRDARRLWQAAVGDPEQRDGRGPGGGDHAHQQDDVEADPGDVPVPGRVPRGQPDGERDGPPDEAGGADREGADQHTGVHVSTVG